jgi:hypothetical protein
MEELVDYLANGQPTTTYPDREAKFVRNHPFMTQLDFFDMQDDQKRAWEQQARDQEAEQVAKDRKESKALVLARDQGAQVKIVSDKEWDDFARRANRSWDAESDTMDTQDKNKRETAANTMRYALVQQTWFPSWGVPTLGWFRNTPDPLIPSPQPSGGQPVPGPARRPIGPKGPKGPPQPAFSGTTADGGQYNIWFNAGYLAKGAARLGAKATLAVGRGMIDFADDVTFDIQGKRAERHAEFEEGNAKGRALNNPLAMMDQAGEERQAAWARHLAANAIQGPEEYDIATPEEEEDDKPAASSSGSGYEKKKKETAAEKAERERREAEARKAGNKRIDRKNAREERLLKLGFR